MFTPSTTPHRFQGPSRSATNRGVHATAPLQHISSFNFSGFVCNELIDDALKDLGVLRAGIAHVALVNSLSVLVRN